MQICHCTYYCSFIMFLCKEQSCATNISQTRIAALKETPIWWFYNRDNMVPNHPPQTDTRICSIIITPTIQR